MKTLGDTGLLPKKKEYDPYSDTYFNCTREGDNRTIDKISAIPILSVVNKAVEMGLVRIEKCSDPDCCDGRKAVMNLEVVWIKYPTCSGNGFRITEGDDSDG